MKPIKCKSCRQPFERKRLSQIVCSDDCAITLAQFLRDKKERAEAKRVRSIDKERKEKLKSRSDWMKEAQTAFNAYIRKRDQLAGHMCISSGRPLNWSGNQVDAGHFLSVGSAPHLRFNEDNVHAQSKHDNQFLSGNAVRYRQGLIERIGLDRVEALESDNTTKKYTIDDLKEIIRTYKQKLKDLSK